MMIFCNPRFGGDPGERKDISTSGLGVRAFLSIGADYPAMSHCIAKPQHGHSASARKRTWRLCVAASCRALADELAGQQLKRAAANSARRCRGLVMDRTAFAG